MVNVADVVITPLFRASNYAEAGLWAVIGVGAFVVGTRRKAVRRKCYVLAAAMLAFGASDVVETRTGAWWRPWWLLVWKGLCLAAFLALLVGYARTRRRLKRSEAIDEAKGGGTAVAPSQP